MKLKVEVSQVTFTVTRCPAPKLDASGAQKVGSGGPVWRLQVLALSPDDAELVDIVIHGSKPAVLVGQRVTIVDLEVPQRGGKSKKVFRAKEIRCLQQ